MSGIYVLVTSSKKQAQKAGAQKAPAFWKLQTRGRRTRFSRILRVVTHARPHHIEFFRSLGPSKTFWGTVYVNPRDASEFAGRAPLSLF